VRRAAATASTASRSQEGGRDGYSGPGLRGRVGSAFLRPPRSRLAFFKRLHRRSAVASPELYSYQRRCRFDAVCVHARTSPAAVTGAVLMTPAGVHCPALYKAERCSQLGLAALTLATHVFTYSATVRTDQC
jgi:hypothetical protein